MDLHRPSRIDELFHQAADLSLAERSAFLERACAGDDELRQELESLLAADATQDGFLRAAVDQALEQLPITTKENSEPLGQRVGRYTITGLIGQGGMGAVYRAVRTDDFRMEVALKFLKHGTDTEAALSRFRSERQILANLQHPHIARLLDGGSTEAGLPYFVMEYVDGTPLLDYAAPLSIRQHLELFCSICSAVQYAHQHRVIHRDIKPANILVTREGTPKLLDFGIAKLVDPVAEGAAGTTLTMAGVRLMTPDYASPEQVRGEPITAATDIYQLGAVLYELLTGQRAHHIETCSPSEIEKAICRQEPKKPSALAKDLVPDLDNIVLKALRKEPERRYRSVNELVEDLDRFLQDLPVQARPDSLPYRVRNTAEVREALPRVMEGAALDEWAAPKRRRWRAGMISVMLAGGTLGISLVYLRPTPSDARVVRFSFMAPGHLPFADLALSPEGSKLAISGTEQTVGLGLWLRSLDSVTMQELAVGASRVEQGGVIPPPYPERTTQNVYNPFWSPDGHFVAFLTPGKLNKIGWEGPSSVQTIWSHRPSGARGGSWNAEGTIIIPNSLTGGLVRVSAGGGTPTRVTVLNSARQELAHRYPEFLPDGRHFLYWVWSASEEYTGIYLGSLDSDIKSEGEHPLVRTLRKAVYTSPGYLLFLEDSNLFAQRFDPGRLRLSGEPIQLPAHVATSRETGQAFFAVSSRVFAYQEASSVPEYRILQLDRQGKQLKTIETTLRSAGTLSLSPDEKHLALDGNSKADVEDIWMVDRERGISSRLTASLASNDSPVWAPDGRRVLFQSNRRGVYDLYIKDCDGLSREEELLLESEVGKVPTDWSRNGRFVVYHQWDPKTNFDLWLLPMAGDRKPFPFARTEFNESFGKFSPVPDRQGHLWMAYASDETGRNEIYLQRMVDVPGLAQVTSDNEVRISIGGGDFPSWRADGKELFYISPEGKLMAVDVKLGVPVAISAPRPLFAVPKRTSAYVPLRDGRRFLLATVAAEPPPATINVVVNWATGLK